jgi:hypothetical protein
MIEQSIVHLPNLVKEFDRPVSIYLVHLSSAIGGVLDGFPVTCEKGDRNARNYRDKG